MDKKKSRVLALLLIDGKAKIYFQEIPLKKMPVNWEIDTKLKYYYIKPMKQWRIKFENSKVNLDINFEGRFPVFNSTESFNPFAFLKKNCLNTEVAVAQIHYEQPMIVAGTLTFKRKGDINEIRNIKAFGHRDHSWGIRDWSKIDSWNWVVIHFEDETINFYKAKGLGEIKQDGIIYSKNHDDLRIKNIEVFLKTRKCEKTPISTTFILTDENVNNITIKSETIFSQYLPISSKKTLTEIYEQVAVFTCDGKEGDGTSEYLFSTRE